MDSLFARTSRVENYLNMLLTKFCVSKNIFISQFPVNIKSEWNDMVLIDVNGGGNKNAYNTYSANIFLYGRPIGDSLKKNVKVIDAMEEKLDEAIKNSTSEHYSVTVNFRDADYDNTRNFHFNVVNVMVIAR